MSLTYSPPPGITMYLYSCAGKYLKSVIAILPCFFAMPAFSQLRILTGKKENANPAAKWPVVGPGYISVRELAANISVKLESTVAIAVKAPSVTSRRHEKSSSQELFGYSNH